MLRVDEIIEQIETYAELEFDKSKSYSFFKTTNTIYYNLYLWLARQR